MRNKTEFAEETEERTNVVDLKLVRSEEEPPFDGTTPGWLMRLNKGTVFTVYDKKDPANYQLLQLQVVAKSEKSMILYENLRDVLFGRPHPARFEQRFTLSEILKEFTEEELRELQQKDEVASNEQRDRIQGNAEGATGELADDVGPPRLN